MVVRRRGMGSRSHYLGSTLLQPQIKRGFKPAELAKEAERLGVAVNRNYGQATVRQEPRAMRFSLRFSF